MFKKLDTMLLVKKMQLEEKAKDFFTEERGASDMAAVMVLVVIVVALATAFNAGLKDGVDKAVRKLTDFIDTTN